MAERKNKKITCYLAGAIQKAVRTPWRDDLGALCEELGLAYINPEKDNSYIFHPSILGWHDNGEPKDLEHIINYEETKAEVLLKQTEDNDLKYIKESDVIFFYYDDRAGHGTMTEFDKAFDWGKQIILVRTVSRKDMAHWNLWRRNAGVRSGQIHEFRDLGIAYDYIRRTYGNNKELS